MLVTIYVPHSPGFLIQLLNYVGDQRQKNTGGRKFPSYCGIIGKAFQGRTGEDMIVGSRKNVNYTNYINELVNQWHYPEELARKLDAETMSWVAMPLNLNGRVEGILYLDAIKKDFFTESRKTLILGAAAGIAGYVAQRYS